MMIEKSGIVNSYQRGKLFHLQLLLPASYRKINQKTGEEK